MLVFTWSDSLLTEVIECLPRVRYPTLSCGSLAAKHRVQKSLGDAKMSPTSHIPTVNVVGLGLRMPKGETNKVPFYVGFLFVTTRLVIA